MMVDSTRVAGCVAYIGLGSNLDEPKQQILNALDELDELPRSHLAARSSLYASPPMGPADQPDYINAVARLDTGLEPHDLLECLHAIEQRHGRRRERRWGPRTLDLDLLLYGGQRIDDEHLTLPHPGIAERAFVLLPLRELAPDLPVPGLGKTVGELADSVSTEGIGRL